jgi:hypothetical protein
MDAAAAVAVSFPVWRGDCFSNYHGMLETSVRFPILRNKAHNEHFISAIGPLMDRNNIRFFHLSFLLRVPAAPQAGPPLK